MPALRTPVVSASAEPIVVVEDELMTNRAVCRLLAQWGYEPIPARSVAEARAILDRTSVDAAVLDVELDDGFGFDLIPRLRAIPAASVVLTGRPEEHAAAAVAYGVTHILRKPVRSGALGGALLLAPWSRRTGGEPS